MKCIESDGGDHLPAKQCYDRDCNGQCATVCYWCGKELTDDDEGIQMDGMRGVGRKI